MTWLRLSQSGFLTVFFFFPTETRRGKKTSLSFLEKIWSWKLPVALWRNHSSSFSSSTSVLLSYIRQKQTSTSLLLHKLIQVGFLSLGMKSILINGVGGLNWGLSKEPVVVDWVLHKKRQRMGRTNKVDIFRRCLIEIQELDQIVEAVRKSPMAKWSHENPSPLSVFHCLLVTVSSC